MGQGLSEYLSMVDKRRANGEDLVQAQDFRDSQGNPLREGLYRDIKGVSNVIYLNSDFSKVHEVWFGSNSFGEQVSYNKATSERLTPLTDAEIDFLKRQTQIHERYLQRDSLRKNQKQPSETAD